MGSGVNPGLERDHAKVLRKEGRDGVYVWLDSMGGVPMCEQNVRHREPLTIELGSQIVVAHRREEIEADSPQLFCGVIQPLLTAPAHRHQTTMDRLNSSTHSLAFFSSLAV